MLGHERPLTCAQTWSDSAIRQYLNPIVPVFIRMPRKEQRQTGGESPPQARHHHGAAVVAVVAAAGSGPATSGGVKRLSTRGTPRGYAATARHHMVIDRGFSGVPGFRGVSPAVAADAPPIATPRRRLRGHERGGLDDDGGVVTMACKAGDDGGSVVIVRDSPESGLDLVEILAALVGGFLIWEMGFCCGRLGGFWLVGGWTINPLGVFCLCATIILTTLGVRGDGEVDALDLRWGGWRGEFLERWFVGFVNWRMSSMGELTFFLGLQVQQKKDDIFISQDKYVDKTLKKFRFTKVKTASTPMETQKPLLKDEDGEEVDVHMYRYLKGQPKLGLWYSKDSPFDLVAYTDSYYAGASLDRTSTTRDLLAKAFDNGIGVNAGDSKLMLLDGTKIIVTEASVRSDLQLADEEAVEYLPNYTIFE
ncbi:putative ribonuclease H-like domain-containing protein [Tanacetum coccineum]|uniref:Ribonuclease H-like domain-containing protein n=1 Tax=Tanacetum coccineum TaxID=301880 RepID=A0ABQ4ZLI0_9ASTR